NNNNFYFIHPSREIISVHRDADRVPAEISMARCLCDGCIINLREVSSYNSVLVCAQTTVLRRKPCPSDPNKFVVWKELMAVPVGCTCKKFFYLLVSQQKHYRCDFM
uniref:Interleukin 17c n=1 Tax=Xiphophorus couchianus TaxID=32473 RepID=A0A3B5L0W2_9TELE